MKKNLTVYHQPLLSFGSSSTYAIGNTIYQDFTDMKSYYSTYIFIQRPFCIHAKSIAEFGIHASGFAPLVDENQNSIMNTKFMMKIQTGLGSYSERHTQGKGF